MDASILLAILPGAGLVALLGAWAFRRRRRAVVRLASPATPRVIPLVRPLDEKALAALPLPIRVCPDCGYLGIRSASLSEGAYVGGGELLSAQFCPHCGYEGPPAEFDDAETYAEYVAGLHQARRRGPTSSAGTP